MDITSIISKGKKKFKYMYIWKENQKVNINSPAIPKCFSRIFVIIQNTKQQILTKNYQLWQN